MVAAAIIGGAALSAGASVLGSSKQAGAANKAAALLSPYAKAGVGALGPIQGLLGLTPGTSELQALQNTPGYQFTLQQGLEGVQNSYAARGLASSGAALKGAANYTTGLAQNTYNQQLQNYMNFAGMGANAAAGVGSNLIGAANAQAAGLVGASNSIGSGALTYALLNNSAPAASGLGGYAGTGYANAYDLPGGIFG